MSTKIYDGFRFVPSDLNEIHTLLMGYRGVVKDAVHEAKCRFLATTAADLIDGAALGRPVTPYPLSTAGEQMRHRQKQVVETGRRDPEIDFDFKLAVMPCGARVYGIAYCDQPEWKAAFLAQPWIEPWPYWNSTDGPEDISPADWETRGRVWGAVLAGDEWDRPVGCGFEYDFVPPPRQLGHEEVLARVPSHERRVRRCAVNAVVDTEFRRLCDDAGVKPGARESMQFIFEAQGNVEGEAGDRLREIERQRIAPLLPTIDIPTLLGWAPDELPLPQSTTAQEAREMAETPTHATLFVSISTDAYEDCASIAECWRGKALTSTPLAIRERIEDRDKVAREIAAAIRAKGEAHRERIRDVERERIARIVCAVAISRHGDLDDAEARQMTVDDRWQAYLPEADAILGLALPPDDGLFTSELECLARSIAAEKVGSTDPAGWRLPDDVWQQALPEARRRLAVDAPGKDGEAAELFQSERISAALATYDYILGDLEPDDPDREERTFDAMKAAIQKADHIARTGQLASGGVDGSLTPEA